MLRGSPRCVVEDQGMSRVHWHQASGFWVVSYQRTAAFNDSGIELWMFSNGVCSTVEDIAK